MPSSSRSTSVRLFGGISGHSLSSISNAALTLAIAHAVSAEDLGVFAVGYGALTVVQGIIAAAAAQAYLATDSAVLEPQAPRTVAGSALLISGPIALCACFALVVLWDQPALTVLLASALPIAAVQDAYRIAAIKMGSLRVLHTMELGWIVAGISVIGAGLGLDIASVHFYLVGWICGAIVAMVIGMRHFGAPANLNSSVAWMFETKAYALRYATEFVGVSGTPYALVAICAASLGFEPAGALRVLQTLFGLINIPLVGAVAALTGTFADTGRRMNGWLHVAVPAISFALLPLAAWYLVLRESQQLLIDLLGSNVVGPLALGGVMAVYSAGGAAISGTIPAHRAAGAARASVRLRTATSLAVIAVFAATIHTGLPDGLRALSFLMPLLAGYWIAQAAYIVTRIRSLA